MSAESHGEGIMSQIGGNARGLAKVRRPAVSAFELLANLCPSTSVISRCPKLSAQVRLPGCACRVADLAYLSPPKANGGAAYRMAGRFGPNTLIAIVITLLDLGAFVILVSRRGG